MGALSLLMTTQYSSVADFEAHELVPTFFDEFFKI